MDETDLSDKAIPKDAIKKFKDIDNVVNGWEEICSKASDDQKSFFNELEFNIRRKTKQIEEKLNKVQLGVKTGLKVKCKSDNELKEKSKKLEVKSFV